MKDSQVTLVIMSCEERRLPLLANLEALPAEVLVVGSCQEARRTLQTHPAVDIVITDVTLPDGNWCDVLTFLVDHGIDAGVVVASRTADEILWSEVLWRGVYDMIVEPFDSRESRWVIEAALRHAHASEDCVGSEVVACC